MEYLSETGSTIIFYNTLCTCTNTNTQQILLQLWPLYKCIYQPSKTESYSGILPSTCSCLKSSHSYYLFFLIQGDKNGESWKPYHFGVTHTILCIFLFLFLILYPPLSQLPLTVPFSLLPELRAMSTYQQGPWAKHRKHIMCISVIRSYITRVKLYNTSW